MQSSLATRGVVMKALQRQTKAPKLDTAKQPKNPGTGTTPADHGAEKGQAKFHKKGKTMQKQCGIKVSLLDTPETAALIGRLIAGSSWQCDTPNNAQNK